MGEHAVAVGYTRRVSSLRSGDHVCLKYVSAAEQEAVLAAFVVGGLERNERVFYFSDTRDPANVQRALEYRGIDVERHASRRRLSLATAQESYLASGEFDPDACIQGWVDTAAEAVADGYSGIRVAGDLGWAMRPVPGADRLLEYEARIQTEVFPLGTITGMCEVDCTRFEPATCDALTLLHPDGIVCADMLAANACMEILPTFEPFGAKVFGEIDMLSNDAFEQALQYLIASSTGDVQLDMSGVRFIGAASLSVLARSAARLEGERRLIVTNLAPRFRYLIERLAWPVANAIFC